MTTTSGRRRSPKVRNPQLGTNDIGQRNTVLYVAPTKDGLAEEQVDGWAEALAPQYNVSNVISGSRGPIANTTVATGPYFVHIYTGHVYEAYKLYVDTSQAFIQVNTARRVLPDPRAD